jgi:hypothetical protein
VPPLSRLTGSGLSAHQSLLIAIRSELWKTFGTWRPRYGSQGFQALADSIDRSPGQAPEPVRTLALLGEWGDRGLSRAEVSALFRKHGFAPQTAGGWARCDRMETRDDGRRYITASYRRWFAEQDNAERR